MLHVPNIVASESFGSAAEHFCIEFKEGDSSCGAVKLPMAVLKTALRNQVPILICRLHCKVMHHI